MRILPFLTLSALSLSACTPPPAKAPDTPKTDVATPAAAPDVSAVPAGDYRLDASHASLIFKVNHTGMSTYTAGFDRFDVKLKLDPAHPETATLTATVDVKSLDIPAPPAGFVADLLGATWFDAAKHPQMTFVSTRVEKTGAATAKIHGDLTLRGVIRPVVLDATFIGGYAGYAPYDPQARVGFSATAKIKRSEFGMTYGIPAPGSTMGVGDEVDIQIDAELSGPPLKSAT